jgi:hypothetical protein
MFFSQIFPKVMTTKLADLSSKLFKFFTKELINRSGKVFFFSTVSRIDLKTSVFNSLLDELKFKIWLQFLSPS